MPALAASSRVTLAVGGEKEGTTLRPLAHGSGANRFSLITVKEVMTQKFRLYRRSNGRYYAEDNLTGKRRIWYKFSDRYIRSEQHLQVAFNYIHYNSVKHGYVKDPFDWDWSSLALYYEDKGRNWLQEQWKSFTPPTDFGKGWDDDVEND